MRFEPLVPVLARECDEDLEIEGVVIPAGEPFLLSILAANRDPAVFRDPDRFDLGRSGPHSFSFGWGAHRCLGAAFAQAEIEEVLPVFFSLFRRVELVCDPEWVPFANLRRLDAVHLCFTPN